VLIFSAEPQTDKADWDLALKSGWQLTVVLVNLWVDEQGNPTHIRIVRPYAWQQGKGDTKPPVPQEVFDRMNQGVLDAIKQYRFKPAMEDGKPVVVALNVEVNFQIF
jgi:periplasmic protein TonB